MEERLRSRFQWGLIADIQPPELETRVAILKTKAQALALELPDEVAKYLAAHIRTNVRELEGALLRLAAFAQLTRGPLTVETCRDVLRSVLHNRGDAIDCDQIIKAVGERFKVTPAEIKGPVRKRNIARARQVAMWLCRRITKQSYPDLGDRFGGKDHSTVISAIQRVEQLMRDDTQFRTTAEALERELSPVN